MTDRRITRRTALGGGVAALVAAGWALVGRPGLPQPDRSATAAPAPPPARSGRLDWTALGRPFDWTVRLPAGAPTADRLPVCVVLRGKGWDAGSAAQLGYPQALDRVAAGTPAFALATVSGGNGDWRPAPVATATPAGWWSTSCSRCWPGRAWPLHRILHLKSPGYDYDVHMLDAGGPVRITHVPSRATIQSG